jgi:hypothetical protein
MSNKDLLFSAVVALGLPTALWAANNNTAPAGMTAEQIVEKHVAARGGLQAWHAVQTMSWSGEMEAGTADSVARSESYIRQTWGKRSGQARAQMAAPDQPNKEAARQVELPFVLEMKRPGMSRVELQFGGKTAIQVYDGKGGWLNRPYLNREDWEPFSAEQIRESQGKWDLDGPLLDHAAKGTKVALEGVEPVDGHPSYKLKLTLKNGTVQHVWIDSHSFLDVKIEGTPRRMDGKIRPVWITQRDFRSVQGVMVPFMLETAVDGYSDTHKMVIEKIAVNPKLDDARFTKPKA